MALRISGGKLALTVSAGYGPGDCSYVPPLSRFKTNPVWRRESEGAGLRSCIKDSISSIQVCYRHGYSDPTKCTRPVNGVDDLALASGLPANKSLSNYMRIRRFRQFKQLRRGWNDSAARRGAAPLASSWKQGYRPVQRTPASSAAMRYLKRRVDAGRFRPMIGPRRELDRAAVHAWRVPALQLGRGCEPPPVWRGSPSRRSMAGRRDAGISFQEATSRSRSRTQLPQAPRYELPFEDWSESAVGDAMCWPRRPTQSGGFYFRLERPMYLKKRNLELPANPGPSGRGDPAERPRLPRVSERRPLASKASLASGVSAPLEPVPVRQRDRRQVPQV